MSEPVVDRCPNCGAPLALDPGGRCRWCQAHVRTEPAPGAAPYFAPHGTNPLDDEPDDVELLLPGMGLLASLSLLGLDAGVCTWRSTQQLDEQLGALMAAIRAGAKRVQIEAMAGKTYNEFADYSHRYTAAEWWVFKLGYDLVVYLCARPGIDPLDAGRLSSQARKEAAEHHHSIKKALKEAGGGPEGLQQLRAAIPVT